MMFYVLDGKIVSVMTGSKLDRPASHVASLAFAKQACKCTNPLCNDYNAQAHLDIVTCQEQLGWVKP